MDESMDGCIEGGRDNTWGACRKHTLGLGSEGQRAKQYDSSRFLRGGP